MTIYLLASKPTTPRRMLRFALCAGLLGLFGASALAADNVPTATLRPRRSAQDSAGPAEAAFDSSADGHSTPARAVGGVNSTSGASPRKARGAAVPAVAKDPWDDAPSDAFGAVGSPAGVSVGRMADRQIQPVAYTEPANEVDALSSGSVAGRESSEPALSPQAGGQIALPKASTPLALPSPRSAVEADRSQRGMPSLATLLGGLAVVVGLFLLAAWLLRLSMPKGAPTLPREAWEVLGRAPLAGRQQVQLVRCGAKMLLLSVTPGGAETLSEITDPLEVDRLAGICQQARPNSATANFRQMLDGFSRESQPAARRGRGFDRSNLSGEDVSLG